MKYRLRKKYFTCNCNKDRKSKGEVPKNVPEAQWKEAIDSWSTLQWYVYRNYYLLIEVNFLWSS